MNAAGLVFPALRWRGRAVEQIWPEVRAAVDLGVGGFIVFGGRIPEVREVADRARDRAGRSLVFAADLERGAGQQFADATPLPPPAALSTLGIDAIEEAATITAREAAGAGVGWVLAPVADLDIEPANPIIGTRAFGADPASVGAQVRAWIEAARTAGAHTCAKHFPGHGRTTADSHVELATVEVGAGSLEADLAPFRAAIDAGVSSVMIGHVAYPALDASGLPAGMSATVIGMLRRTFGFEGVVVSDALIMGAVAGSGRSPASSAVEMVRAGVDALLYPESVEQTVAALAEAIERGELDAGRIAESLGRIDRLARPAGPPGGSATGGGPGWTREGHVARAVILAEASLVVRRGALPTLKPGDRVALRVIDDDVVGLDEPRHGAPMPSVLDREVFGAALSELGVRVVREWDDADAGSLVHVIAVFSDVRGWKGRAELAPETVAAVGRLAGRRPGMTAILFAHPRRVGQLPGSLGGVLIAWCGDPLMQRAAARRLLRGP